MADTALEQFTDSQIRHQIFLLRYSSHVRNEVYKILGETEGPMAAMIRDKIEAGTGISSARDWDRIERLVEKLIKTRATGWDKVQKYLKKEMNELIRREPESLARAFAASMPVEVELATVRAAELNKLFKRPMLGRTFNQWIVNSAADDSARISAVVYAGAAAGDSGGTIARAMVGTAALQGTDGALQATRNAMQTVVRTMVQHFADGARDEWYNVNEDLFPTERFVATLDGSTTAVCRANDGKVYERGKGPRPPLHFGCRSIRIANVDGVLLESRPFKPTTERLLVEQFAKENKLGNIRSRDALPRGTKTAFDAWARKQTRALIGQVPASTTYQTWLSRQSKAFQEEVLGVTKAKLFRDGGLKLDRFVDASGREYTLSQLAKREAAAFRAAGLDPKDFDR